MLSRFFRDSPALSSGEEPTLASPTRRHLLHGALALAAATLAGRAPASDDIYKTFQTPEAFLAEAFGGAPPAPKTLELDEDRQSQLATVFGRRYPQSRLRYWRAHGRTAWIFDDVGKEGYVPTTAGFVVKGGAIEFARVLVYRESRGEQVAERSFLQQLAGARAGSTTLDRKVDNISGATYSVKMMQRMARTALALDSLAG